MRPPATHVVYWRCTIAILQIVDKLEELLEQGRPVPLSPLRMINADEFGQLLEHLRINVPSSIRESERMLAERDAILADARAEAAQIVAKAQGQAREILSDNALLQAAQLEANNVMEESRLIARQRTMEADHYATNVLEQLADKLDVISQQVNNGLRMMKENALTHADEDLQDAPTPDA